MTTEQRIEKLERQLAATNRRNRWLVGFMVLALAGLGAAWALTQATPVAQAQAAAADNRAAADRPVSLAAVYDAANKKPLVYVLWADGKVTTPLVIMPRIN